MLKVRSGKCHQYFVSEISSAIQSKSASPPRLDGMLSNLAIHRELKNEEDEDYGDGDTDIQRGRQDVVILCPPRLRYASKRNISRKQEETNKMLSANDVVEDEPNNGPWYIVHRGGGRY